MEITFCYICFSFLIFIFFITFLKSRGERYFRLDDGRILCFECMESAITDTGECQPLYHAIRDYYEGMNMRIDQQIPMLLVGREALNEAIVGEKNVMNPSILCFSVIGTQFLLLLLIGWFLPGFPSHARNKRVMPFRRTNCHQCMILNTFCFCFIKLENVEAFMYFHLFIYDILLFQVHRWSKIGGHRLIGMRSQPQKLIRKCEVTAILVLYGLPR